MCTSRWVPNQRRNIKHTCSSNLPSVASCSDFTCGHFICPFGFHAIFFSKPSLTNKLTLSVSSFLYSPSPSLLIILQHNSQCLLRLFHRQFEGNMSKVKYIPSPSPPKLSLPVVLCIVWSSSPLWLQGKVPLPFLQLQPKPITTSGCLHSLNRS